MKNSKTEKVNVKDQHVKEFSIAKKGQSEENSESKNKVSISATFYELLLRVQIPKA